MAEGIDRWLEQLLPLCNDNIRWTSESVISGDPLNFSMKAKYQNRVQYYSQTGDNKSDD